MKKRNSARAKICWTRVLHFRSFWQVIEMSHQSEYKLVIVGGGGYVERVILLATLFLILFSVGKSALTIQLIQGHFVGMFLFHSEKP